MKHNPSKAWFSHPFLHGIAVSTFPYLLRLCSKWHPKPFEIEVCGCLWRQKLVEERFQKHTKNQHQKSKKICQKCAPKRYPEKWSFCGFSGPGAKGVPGWSQRPPRAPYKVKSGRNLYKKGCAKLDFCDVLLGLVPDWTHMPPSASAMFPDNPGRFQSSHPCNLQRATHRPPRKNKQKQINNIHFQFNGILTVLVRRPCAPSKHRLDKGGKPKVDASLFPPYLDASQMTPRSLQDASSMMPPP